MQTPEARSGDSDHIANVVDDVIGGIPSVSATETVVTSQDTPLVVRLTAADIFSARVGLEPVRTKENIPNNQRVVTYFISGNITVLLTSCLIGLDSAALLATNYQQIYMLSLI